MHQRQICHWYQRNRQQILPPVPLVLLTGGKFAIGVSDTRSKLPPVSTTPVANCQWYWYQWHRWQQWEQYQTAESLKWPWRKSFIYMLTLYPKVSKRNNDNFFDWRYFPFATDRSQRHWWCTLSCEYLRKFSKKFETALMVQSGAWGNWSMQKTLSQKSHGTVPLIRKFFIRHFLLNRFCPCFLLMRLMI